MADATDAADPATRSRQVRSLVPGDGTVVVSLVEVPVPEPGPDEVVIRVGGAPVNPSDLGVLLAGADPASGRRTGTADVPAATFDLPPAAEAAVAGRRGVDQPTGNEGAGTVVAAGSSPAAQALLGRVVAVYGGAMYADHRLAAAADCLLLHEGTTAAEGASCFVNPLTVLGFLETMRIDGHTALVHTAAASNLGRMLVRACAADGVPLVNVVRRPEQVELLRGLGAEHVVDTSAGGWTDDLDAALAATGATLAFDAIGGGELASEILAAMERVAAAKVAYNRYGTATPKHVYLYGSLDRSPTLLRRRYGSTWGVGGWLLPPFLERVGPEVADRLRRRVADEITTTFASAYSATLALEELVDPDAIRRLARFGTGEKQLVVPDSGTSS